MDSDGRPNFQPPSLIYTDGQGNPVQQQQVDWLSGFPSPAVEFEACNAIELDRWKDIPFQCLLALAGGSAPGMAAPASSSAWNNTDLNLGVQDPIPVQYDLNLPEQSMAESFSFGGINFPFAPVTPQKTVEGTRVEPATALEKDVRGETGHGLPCGETTDNQADARNVALVPDPVPDSSSTVGLTTLENPNREKVDINVIDLNKAPPRKKPKRKKHVPKVLVEGQKPKTPKPQTPKQPRRKYERKKEASPPAAAAAGNGEVENPNMEDCATSNANQPGKKKNKMTDTPTSPVTKEGTPRIRKKYTRKAAQENASAENPTGTVGEPAASEAISGGKPGCTTPPWEATGESVDPQGPPLLARKSCRRALDFSSQEAGIPSFTKKPSSPNMMSEPVAKSQLGSISFGDGIEVRKQNSRTGSPFNFESSVKELLKSYSPKAGNQAKTKETDMLATQCMQQHSTPMSLSNASGCSSFRTLTEVGGASGSANTNCSPSEPAMNMTGHFYNGLSIYQTLPWALMPECRKKRSEKAQNSAVSSIPVASPAARKVNYFPNYTHSHDNGLLSGTVGKGESAGLLQYKLHNFSPLNEIERSTKRRSKTPIRVQDMGALVTIPHHNNRHIQNLNRPEARMGALLAGPQATLKKPKNSKRDSLGRYASSGANDKGMMVSFTRNQFSGSLETLFNQMLTVDDLAEQLKFLNINRESPNVTFNQRKELVPYKGRKKKQNAMVLYNGDKRIVPYESGKRKRPRAKVQLDQETLRVFNLLLKSIDSEGIDGTDEAKAKYWEEERKIFRGRTDSFIARMHLVQGDRRFSRWKGSVVDSVIGVFLTQNVSDHLSSSAFMSMAARFPIKRPQEPLWEEGGTQSIVINPTVSMPDDECLNWDAMSNQSFSDQISTTLGEPRHEDTEVAHNLNSTRRTSSNIGFTPGKENYDESAISQNSSQNSNSPVSQTFDNIKESCTETNSQEVDTCDGGAQLNSLDGGSNSFVELLQKAQSGSTLLPKEQSTNLSGQLLDIVESSNKFEKEKTSQNTTGSNLINHAPSKVRGIKDLNAARRRAKSRRVGDEIKDEDWEALRRTVLPNGIQKERAENAKDSVDWEAVRQSGVDVIADTIKARGMNNLLAARIKELLDKLITFHGSIDLEWLRDVPPDKAKEYLLSFNGLGLKSVECVRLLTLHHLAFPVDTNVGRIAVRLGWVPLEPLPESLQLHLLEMYPILDTIQKYLWPRLCKLDQKTLYELHYQLITFGKVFCTKSKPNCNACPMRGECRHFASAFASARLSLTGPEEKRMITAQPQDHPTFPDPVWPNVHRAILPPPTICEESQPSVSQQTLTVTEQENHQSGTLHMQTVKARGNCQPIIEEPLSPEPQCTEATIDDIEDAFYEDPDEIPTIRLNVEELAQNLESYIKHNMDLREGDISLDLVAMATEATYIPPPKLKNVSRLRTEHHVYELQDSHPLVQGLERREADDPSPYLLAIWTPGETAKSVEPPETVCTAQSQGKVCDEGTCPSCSSFLEARRQIVRGTILIPCRTAMRGSFPLNGTYYQVNEVFADHETSLHPIDVPRQWLWDLPRRTVYFGTSVPTIFRGLTTEQIQQCFWKGFVCVRGFDRRTRAPRPLQARLHFPASKMKGKEKGKNVAYDDE